MDIMDLTAGFPVCVRCMTYNQSEYISDALNGFCMQKTAFPYYVVVFDDASTDGEQKVIKTYLDENFNCSEAHGYKKWEREEACYVFAQHLENTNCHFLVVYLKKNLYKTNRKDELINEWCKAKYIALCEGDDYWTDKNRLQKMVEFLESHPKYVLVTHRINRYYESTGELEDDKGCDVYYGKKNGISFGRYYNRFIYWQTQTLRTMYRMDAFRKATANCPMRLTDGILSYWVLKYGRGYGINEYMGTYRVHSGGVWSGISAFEKVYGNMLMFRSFYQYEKSLFALLCYYDSYINVYKQFPEELKSREPIKRHIVFFKKFRTLFLCSKDKYFEIKRKKCS